VTYQQPYPSLVNERKFLTLIYVSGNSQILTRRLPIASGARASRPSSEGRARAETTEAEMARSVRMDPKFFMMIDVKVRSVKLVDV
jgi:hypothetical protein